MIPVTILLSLKAAILVSITFFFVVSLVAVSSGLTIIPENWEYNIEILGQYLGYPLEAGPHIFFRLFGVVRIRSKVFKGQQLMKLFLNDQITTGFGGGSVEFKDCSSSLRVSLYLQIMKSDLSTYAVQNLFKAVEEKTDSLVRGFLGDYTLEEAIEMNGDFTILTIVLGSAFLKSNPTDDEIKARWENSDYYKTLFSWGIMPVSLALADFELTPALEEKRVLILQAEKELEIAEIKRKQALIDKATAIIKGEANREIQILEGEGQAKKILEISSKTGIPVGEVTYFLLKNKQWEAVENASNTQKTVIIESGNEAIKQGALIGAGMNP